MGHPDPSGRVMTIFVDVMTIFVSGRVMTIFL